MSAPPPPRFRRQPVRLTRRERVVSALVGAAAMGAGGTAVFVTSSEAGPVVLLAAGTLFTFCALVGALPTKLKWGDNEAEWLEEVSELVGDIVDEAAEDSKVRIAASLARLSEVAPTLAAPVLVAAVSEAELLRVVLDALPSGTSASVEPLAPVDLLIHDETGVGLAVELVAGPRHVGTHKIKAAIDRVNRTIRAGLASRGIVLVGGDGELSPGAYGLLEHESLIDWAYVRDAGYEGAKTLLAHDLRRALVKGTSASGAARETDAATRA